MLQVFDSRHLLVTSLPHLTTLVPKGTISAAPASNPTADRVLGSTAPTAHGRFAAVLSAQPAARQFEVQLNFTLHPVAPAGPPSTVSNSNSSNVIDDGVQQEPQQPGVFRFGLRILTGGGSYTDVYLNGTLAELSSATGRSDEACSCGVGAIADLAVWVDRSNAGPATNTTFMEGGPVPLPVDSVLRVPDAKLGLSVWIDHSVIEVYALGGLARVSSRIYPDDDNAAWGLAVWSVPPAAPLNCNSGSVGSTAGNTEGSTEGSTAGGSLPGPDGAAHAVEVDDLAANDCSGAWDVMMDGTVWEVNNAWLPPAC